MCAATFSGCVSDPRKSDMHWRMATATIAPTQPVIPTLHTCSNLWRVCVGDLRTQRHTSGGLQRTSADLRRGSTLQPTACGE